MYVQIDNHCRMRLEERKAKGDTIYCRANIFILKNDSNSRYIGCSGLNCIASIHVGSQPLVPTHKQLIMHRIT